MCLHPLERFALQGFPPEMSAGLSKQQCLELTGNSFSVPVMAAATSQCLRCLAATFPYMSIPAPLTDLGDGDSMRRAMVAIQRREIAITEHLCHICRLMAALQRRS